jgi:glycosyltransferase involved in cell wall biosynthesis/O-antigen ligase
MQRLSFKGINKILLILTLISLSFNLEKGSFSKSFIPNSFQVLLLVTITLTVLYLLKNHKIKEFFLSIPSKVLFAIGFFYLATLFGWMIAIFFFNIPTTLHTVLDFGTFTMGMALFFLVSFYAKDDERYSKLCLYAILIPNFYLLYYFATHGFVGYWGVPTDFSLDNILDPNILSKTLLVPALFFIGSALYVLKDKRWKISLFYILAASIFSMLVFWTVSRGSSLSLILGAFFVWLIFLIGHFSWRKFFLGGVIVLFIILLGFGMLPNNTKHAIYVKSSNTLRLPDSSLGRISNVTLRDIKKLPETESRLLIWYFYPKYITQHPLGIGPNSSMKFEFLDNNGEKIYFGPDSTYLIICLWGGVVGAVSYLYILWSAFILLWKKWKDKKDKMSLVLIATLFSLSVSLFFDGNMSLYWFYVVLALSFLKNKKINNEDNIKMDQEKLISVIIPAYNIENYISKTIESVLSQTYKNLEIIIVDDGSTDNTNNIIQKYAKKEKRIIVLSQNNKGPSAARNLGFSVAKGEYLCIIDGDDIMLPEKIESQACLLESNPSIGFTYSKVYYFKDKINDIYIRDLAAIDGSDLVHQKLLKYGTFITPNSVFFRKNVFDQFGGFDESLRSSEDFDYWLSLSKRGVNFLHQDKYLTLCRIREGSATSNSIVIYSTLITVFERYLIGIKNNLILKIKYPQYIKNKFLLGFSFLKKPRCNKSTSEAGVKSSGLSYCANSLFNILRKIKFFLTFENIDDKKLKDYLIHIESQKIYE